MQPTGAETRPRSAACWATRRTRSGSPTWWPASLGLDADPGESEQVPWAFRRLLEELARRRPVLLVIEDAHWAESPLLDLIDYVADWLTTSRVLVLCLARPELLDRAPALGRRSAARGSIVLGPAR